MQSSKVESFDKYNDILTLSISSTLDFPSKLCEFLIIEFEFESALLFKVDKDNDLILLGKSAKAKKSYSLNSKYSCSILDTLKDDAAPIVFNNKANCEIKASDFVIYEGCLFIRVNNNEKFFFKIAKKTEFTNADKDNIELIGKTLKNYLQIWNGQDSSADYSISETITNITHELRTPTNSIMGFASLLAEEKLTESQKEYLNTLKLSANKLHCLINDLIDLAKLERGQIRTATEATDIKKLVNESISQYSDFTKENGIEIITNFDDSLTSPLNISADKVRFIFSSLLTYSLRQMEKGNISVSVSFKKGSILDFKIADTSPGITTNNLKKIFEPFILSELSNKEVGNATGLSLLLAKKLTQLLGGELNVTSSVGKGTTYEFSLSVDALSSIESKISVLPKAGKKNRILVIEDDYANSKLLSNYLNKWGYEPVIVNSAKQALNEIEKEVFLAVLMDIVLPDANGFELLKTIRAHKNAKNTPVIVCSVEAEQQKAFLMGAVEYFVKPIKYNYLVEVLTSYKLKKDSNILIVDDDEPTLNLIKGAIEQAGYNAIAESHSSKVMGMIENIDLDLAIIDLDMPEVNGFDLIKKIKTNPKFTKLPIVIYTGKENYQDDLKKIDGMFADLLNKTSTNIEDLSETITAMINSYDEPPPKEEVIADSDSTKILLVEDYKHSQIIVTRLLKKNDYESIVVVENGAEAVDEVKKQKFDLILMDMQMPVMNGFEATQRIREMPEYKDTPIIALTAFAMKGDREKCLDAGATDYIPKPIDSNEFIEKVKYYTEEKVTAK
ncbi:MAG TPA: response regulator [Ignavibacteria bacterium]|nr:response regulator [Ignavibacteria bacterium]